jgi:hypothetical protein
LSVFSRGRPRGRRLDSSPSCPATRSAHGASPYGRRRRYGATDEFGYQAVENMTTIYDLHATILYLLGLDHERLGFYHNGTERRLTDVHGHVIREILI